MSNLSYIAVEGVIGVGKTTMAYATAKQLDKQVYFFQATMDTNGPH